MNVNPLKYKTWLIDCDGVILDSNRLKTEVFYDVAIQYGHCNCSFVWSILEILDNAKYAYLVPPKDENALADAMVKLAKRRNKKDKNSSKKQGKGSEMSMDITRLQKDLKRFILQNITPLLVNAQCDIKL